MDAAGEKLDCARVDNDPLGFAGEVSKAPAGDHHTQERGSKFWGEAAR